MATFNYDQVYSRSGVLIIGGTTLSVYPAMALVAAQNIWPDSQARNTYSRQYGNLNCVTDDSIREPSIY